jgi:MarC family membrane protein
MTLGSAIALLVLVMDPFGNVPFYGAALARVAPERRTRVVVRELLIAFAVMVTFLFVGQRVLDLLGISQPALGVAGGIILFLIALRMVFPNRLATMEEDVEGEPFVVPLAVPYVAGPSVLAAELVLISGAPALWPRWLLAVTLAWVVTAVVVLAGSRLTAMLGRRGLIAVERLMGMILVTVAVQMFLTALIPMFS